MRRFHPGIRRSVRRLVRSSPRLHDLACVFPGAIYALATERGPLLSRLTALDLVRTGAALREVAASLALPVWLRRLPPEAFVGPLGPVPSGDSFSRRIANRIPAMGVDHAFWLTAVTLAAEGAHEDLAIWLAEQPLHGQPGAPEHLFGPLILYAWFSRARNARASRLIVVPWRPELAVDTALCAAKSWLNRVRLVLQLRPGVVADPWLAAGSARGFTFTPLLDSHQLLKESQAMQNCADQYADRIARDRCRLFSVTNRAGPVATVEIAAHPREIGYLTIAQLKARHNMPAPVEVWQAAHEWLAMQSGLKRHASLAPIERDFDQAGWEELIAPYVEARGHPAWLPRQATSASFADMDSGLAQLAGRAGVNSWLFT